MTDLGGVPGACPPRVQSLSFRHTKFSKRNHLGSRRPPTGNPGSATGLYVYLAANVLTSMYIGYIVCIWAWTYPGIEWRILFITCAPAQHLRTTFMYSCGSDTRFAFTYSLFRTFKPQGLKARVDFSPELLR